MKIFEILIPKSLQMLPILKTSSYIYRELIYYYFFSPSLHNYWGGGAFKSAKSNTISNGKKISFIEHTENCYIDNLLAKCSVVCTSRFSFSKMDGAGCYASQMARTGGNSINLH